MSRVVTSCLQKVDEGKVIELRMIGGYDQRAKPREKRGVRIEHLSKWDKISIVGDINT
jgi:hypothetical protein